MIKDKNLTFESKSFAKNINNLEWFSSLQNKLSSLIATSKQECFSKIA